ncbi:MAG: F-box protein [Coxiellaceae bacterium]|nr:MAG: F-box protein [Coxiellaceae bacterium]
MLNNLPKDLILKVFSLLGLRDIARVALVSKSLLEMAQEKMPIRDDLKEFVTQNKSLTDAQVNYLLSDNTYSKLINGQFKSIELAMARHDKFVQQESARVSALRYPASGSQIEEQAQQQLALQKVICQKN